MNIEPNTNNEPPFLPPPSAIEEALKGIPGRVDEATRGSNASWTHAVKKALGELGLKHNWGVCTSIKLKGFESEWLFDLTWYSSPQGRLQKLGLILESEWAEGFDAIQYDFEKLLVARAPYKVIVFEASDADREKFFTDLKEIINGYAARSSDELYFLAAYSGFQKQFFVEIVPA